MSVKLVSVNIERHKHLDTVLPFLEREQPDVACIQELFQEDIPLLEKTLGASAYFAPMHREKTGEVMGLGIFSRLPAQGFSVTQYAGQEGDLAVFIDATPEEKNKTSKRIVAAFTVAGSYRIMTTHFTWTPDGQPDDFQRADIRSLMACLQSEKDFALCGDFNAPRGGEIFTTLASHYTDNIPSKYETSIHVALHRAGSVDGARLAHLMVDGLFTTSGYAASDVRLEFGVSDHAAIVATIALSV